MSDSSRPKAASDSGSERAFGERVFRSIEVLSQNVESGVTHNVGLCLIFLSLVFFGCSGVFGAGSPFGVNEILTFYVSSLDSWPTIWSAFEQGIEHHPPLYFLLAHTSQEVFGYGHLGTRVPAIFGTWLACLAIFGLVNRRAGPVFGLAAMLAPFLFQYSSELAGYARGDSLLFGFGALALLCWQVAVSSTGMKRTFALAGLACSLFAVMLSHYYGILPIACIALAELFRAGKSKKLDVPVLFSIALGATALLILFPIIQVVRQYQYHTHPSLSAAVEIYSTLLMVKAAPLVPLLLLPVLLFWLRPNSGGEKGSDTSAQVWPRHEIVGLLVFCASPLLMLLIGLIARSGFEARFAGPALAAFIALGATTLARRSRFPRITGMVLLLPLFAWFSLQQYATLRTGLDRLEMEKPSEDDLSWEASVYNSASSLPIADPHGDRALLYLYYWPPEQSARLSLVTPIPLQEMGLYLSVLIPMTTTLDLQAYDQYTARHRRFLLFGDQAEWFFERLRQDRATLVLLGHAGEHPIFEVTMPDADAKPEPSR